MVPPSHTNMCNFSGTLHLLFKWCACMGEIDLLLSMFLHARSQDTSVETDLASYVPCWYSRHPVLVTNRLPSPGSWRNFISEGSGPVVCADRVCANVSERGVDPKGHICPLVATLHTPWAWVLVRGRVGTLEHSKLLEAAGVWAEPPLSIACPATGFPCCDWLLSLVLAEVCLAAQCLVPYSKRETTCAALTINTPTGAVPANHPP